MKYQFDKIKSHFSYDFFLSFFRLVRFKNLLILFSMDYFARVFLIGDKTQWLNILKEPEIFYLSISTCLIAAAGYIINDYYDIKIDMINKPDRVILNKYIKRRSGLLLHILLNCMALFICIWKLTFNVAIFMGLCGLLLWWYSNYLKRTTLWGNLTIAFLAFSAVSMLALFYQIRVNAILFFAFFAFLLTLIREIIKDMEDTKGDEAFGCRTLPIVAGIAFTKKIIYIVIIITLSVLIASFFVVNSILYLYLLAFAAIPMVILFYMLYKADKPSDFSMLSNFAKYQMILGIIGMVLV